MATRATHKARGATHESDIQKDARAKGYESDKIARAGAKDQGDVIVRDIEIKGHAIVEAKAPGLDGKIDIPGWLREAKVEAQNYADARGMDVGRLVPMVVIKARGKSIDEAYVVMRWGDVVKQQRS